MKTLTVEERVRAAVADVPDPELPPVTLGMLGMIHDVGVDADVGHATIELLPTFSGCPATEMMGRDVEEVVLAVDGIESVTVQWRFSPRWSSDRITPEGHERLREFGIAPPTGTAAPPQGVAPDGRRSLPVAGSPAADGPKTGPASDPRPCPYCGSTDTTRDAPFGPTPCRDVRFCESCQHPFEAFKSL